MDIVEMREFIAKTHIQIAREANKRKLSDKQACGTCSLKEG